MKACDDKRYGEPIELGVEPIGTVGQLRPGVFKARVRAVHEYPSPPDIDDPAVEVKISGHVDLHSGGCDECYTADEAEALGRLLVKAAEHARDPEA